MSEALIGAIAVDLGFSIVAERLPTLFDMELKERQERAKLILLDLYRKGYLETLYNTEKERHQKDPAVSLLRRKAQEVGSP